MILYAAADLLWATRIKATGEKVGTPCRPIRSLEMLELRLNDEDVRAVLLDLDISELAFAVMDRLRADRATESERTITLVAWGPHVMVSELAEARARGCDRVLTRGQFANELAGLLADLNDAGRADA